MANLTFKGVAPSNDNATPSHIHLRKKNIRKNFRNETSNYTNITTIILKQKSRQLFVLKNLEKKI